MIIDSLAFSYFREVLLAGGSAVDSAIAIALYIGVASSQSSGIGGGAFMLIYVNLGLRKMAPQRRNNSGLRKIKMMTNRYFMKNALLKIHRKPFS